MIFVSAEFDHKYYYYYKSDRYFQHETKGIFQHIRRIATIMDTIKNSKNYVIVPNAITDMVNISNTRLAWSPQAIAFSGEKPPYLRWMQPIKNADYLSDILKATHHCFPMCDHIVLKLLTSKPGNAEQATHEDFVPDESTGTMQNLE